MAETKKRLAVSIGNQYGSCLNLLSLSPTLVCYAFALSSFSLLFRVSHTLYKTTTYLACVLHHIVSLAHRTMHYFYACINGATPVRFTLKFAPLPMDVRDGMLCLCASYAVGRVAALGPLLGHVALGTHHSHRERC